MARFQPADATTAAAFRAAAGEVEFAVDAGKVNTREEGWKDLKMAVISKREAGEAASPAGWEERAAAGRDDGARVRHDRHRQDVPAGVAEPVAPPGRDAVGRRPCPGDGAGWIWKSVNRALTGCVQTLDIFHASERLAAVAAKAFGEGTADARAAFERGRGLLLERGWAGVCAGSGSCWRCPDDAERERRAKLSDGRRSGTSRSTSSG